MDLRHLDPDELEVEFKVRKLDPNSESAVESLFKIITEEQSGMRLLPSLPSLFKISSEMSLCKRKMTQMEQERLERVASGNESALEVLRSRALHVVSRLERLAAHSSAGTTVSKTLEDARQLWARLVPTQLEDAESNASDEIDLGVSTASGTGLPPSANVSGSGHRQSTGAIPKQVSNPRSNLPPPSYQFPAWNIDPSIIKTGRASLPPSSNAAPGSAFQSFVKAATQARADGQSRCEPNPIPIPVQPPSNLFSNGQAAVQGRNRPGLTHTLSKWTVRFGGSAKDLAVDEFFFRVENLATADNVHADSLVLGLHCLLTGNASDFYWVQRRKYPNHVWAALKSSMIAHFAKQETDLEIRKLIMERRQAFNEGFGDFSLAVECLAARLTRQMDDLELMEILRQNMSSKLQTCLLMYPTPNVEILKGACRKFERLWATQSEPAKDRRISSRMAELGFDDNPQVEAVRGPNDAQLNYTGSCQVFGDEQEAVGYNVAALNRPRQIPNRGEYMICWNCDDIGHSFGDCTSPDRKVFCYGCGSKNAYKPSCVKCNPGNAKPGGIVQGQFRSTPNPFALPRANPSKTP